MSGRPPRRRKPPLINPGRERVHFPPKLSAGLSYVHWCTLRGKRYCMGWSRTSAGHHADYVLAHDDLSDHRAYYRPSDVPGEVPDRPCDGVMLTLPRFIKVGGKQEGGDKDGDT